MRSRFAVLALVGFFVFSLSGCGVIQKMRRADELEEEVTGLKERLAQLQREKEEAARAAEEKEQELSELDQAQKELAEALEKEIGEYKAKLEMTQRGLVITFLSEVFFASGRDVIKTDGEAVLQKVAQVLNKDVPQSPVAIEGHTDNEPIKHSGWKSNWELSCARALAVLHYLIDAGKIQPERLSANGYGEYKPVAANDTPQGRQKNRRVEIVILPSQIKKVK